MEELYGVIVDTSDKLDNITIDYAGFHGPVASAMVNDDPGLEAGTAPFLKELVLSQYDCYSEEHDDDECVCIGETEMKRIFIEHLVSNGLYLVWE